MAQRTGQSPDRFRHLREGVGGKPTVPFFQCEICGLPYPETTMKVQSGRRVCVDDWEEEGGEIERDLAGQRLISRGADREARKRIPKYPFTHPKLIGITDISPKPVPMVASGPSVEVILTGVNLSSDDVTLAYGGSVTDATSPAYAADGTTITLDLDPGAAAGDYDLTFNGKLYRKVFQVR